MQVRVCVWRGGVSVERRCVVVCVPLHREGIFVRVLSHIRTFSQMRSVVGFLVQPLKDFNEVTYHMVHVVHSQLALQKGAPVVRGGEGSGWGVRCQLVCVGASVDTVPRCCSVSVSSPPHFSRSSSVAQQ